MRELMALDTMLFFAFVIAVILDAAKDVVRGLLVSILIISCVVLVAIILTV